MSPTRRAADITGLRLGLGQAPVSEKRVSEMTTAEIQQLAAPRAKPAAYGARISHTTTPAQLEALEALRTAEKATGDGAVSITALLRAATALCLDDPRLRARWIKAARGEWR